MEDPQIETEIKEKIIDPYMNSGEEGQDEEQEEENVVGFMTENPYQ